VAIQLRALEQLQAFTILAPATVSTNNDTTAVNVSAVDGDLLLLLLYAAAGGADQTIAVKVQHSTAASGAAWVDVPSGAFATLTNTAGLQKLSIPRDEVGGFIRLSFTGKTSTYSATVSVVAVGGARYAV
jgi:hypothetical protein